jgi:S-adenosylmethionine decarboxylase
VTLDIFVCNFAADNTGKAQQVLDTLVPRFEAARIERQRLVRGAPAEPRA